MGLDCIRKWTCSICILLLKRSKDLLFDCAAMYDLSRLEIQVVEAKIPAKAQAATDEPQPLIGGAWVSGGTDEAVSRGAWSTPPKYRSQEPYDKYASKILP